MSENRKCFTFMWKIKNFNFCFSKVQIISPVFLVHVLGGTKWRLYINTNSYDFKDCIACGIQGLNSDSAPDELELDFELSFLASDGSVLHSEIFLKILYKSGYYNRREKLLVKKDEVFILEKDLFMPDDTFTIRCRMWNCQNSISLSGRCFAETLIETQCKSFVGNIEKFNCLEEMGKYPLCSNSSTETFLSSMSLCVLADGKLLIEIELVNQKTVGTYRYEIFIRDSFGNKVKYGQSEFYDSKPHFVPLTVSKEQLMENKKYYLPKDGLIIECKVTFRTGQTTEKLGAPEYGFGYEDTKEIISNSMKTNFSSKEHHLESLTTLKDDLNSLFREGVLWDTKLKTATETFPAHIAVLSARSPVFKSMFTIDMKEKTNKCVDIDDLDADTVRRMLLFMYTDTLDDLEYESAKNLYIAADKYNIVSLRHRCSNFLKQNILLKNCCDVLFLADKHQNEDLKNAVQDFIAKNDEAVLFSDEWKNLEKNHPHLMIEVLRAVYMKNRK